jgi:hypothetical protein
MNTPTLIASLIMAALLALLIGFFIRQTMRGWLHRAQRQAELIGTLPPLPETVGPAIIPATKGLYVGSTIAPSWQDRIAVGGLGFRSKAVLTRYPEGIMVQRTGAGPIWIPDESITAIRTERGIAGKVIPGGRSGATRGNDEPQYAILAIRWKLRSGTEIDTGFRGDDRRELANWVEEAA